MTPSPYWSTVNVATTVLLEFMIVPLMLTVGGVPELVMTAEPPLMSETLIESATKLPFASNSTDPLAVRSPSTEPPLIVKGGVDDNVMLPSEPFEIVSRCEPANVTSPAPSTVAVTPCNWPWPPNDSLIFGTPSLSTQPPLPATL